MAGWLLHYTNPLLLIEHPAWTRALQRCCATARPHVLSHHRVHAGGLPGVERAPPFLHGGVVPVDHDAPVYDQGLVCLRDGGRAGVRVCGGRCVQEQKAAEQ